MNNLLQSQDPSPDQLLETLIPQATPTFRQNLEEHLMTHLHTKQSHSSHLPKQSPTLTRQPRATFSSPSRWGIAIVAILSMGVGAIVLSLSQNRLAMSLPSATQISLESPMVVASDEYLTTRLSLQPDTLQGLTTGDRVDVLGIVDGKIRTLAAHVLLTDIQPAYVVLAAPQWQIAILGELSKPDVTYALRLHTGDAPVVGDSSSVEYVFISPEMVPQEFIFDIIVGIPVEQGYLLADLPFSIDDTPFTFNGDTLSFRFKEIERVSVVKGTAVTIRLSQADAANLDYLMKLSMSWSLVPDEGR